VVAAWRLSQLRKSSLTIANSKPLIVDVVISDDSEFARFKRLANDCRSSSAAYI
jgi:hypothetical protein